MTKRQITYLLALICLTAISGYAGVSVSLTTDVDQASVGDWIPLRLSATVPKGSEVQFPLLEEVVGDLVVLDSQVGEAVRHGDEIYQELTATVAAYDTGTFKIPALPVMVFAPGDSEGEEYWTEPLQVIIQSVLPDSGFPEPVDIRSQVDVPITAWEVIWKVLVGLAIVALGYGITRWRVWRKRRKGELPIPVPPPIPAHELAYRELMELQEKKLWQVGKLNLHYTGLSEIIRRYLEGRYRFPALEMGTWDIKQVLQDYIDRKVLRSKIDTWMDSADLVKFAKKLPEWEECERALDFAYKIVDATKAVPIMDAPQESTEAHTE